MLVSAVVLCAAGAPASAATITGNQFYDRCKGDGSAYCIGYVLGVVDTQNEALVENGCYKNLVAGQIVDVTTKYLRENPAKRNKPAPDLIREALLAAFPC